MNEENNQKDSRDFGSDPEVPIIHVPPPEHPHHSTIETKHRHHYVKRSAEFMREHWPTANTWGAIGNWITAFATVVMVIVYIQIKGIMNSQGGQTDQLIAAANIQAGAAGRFADSAAKINIGIGTAVGKLNLQAKSLQSSVGQATRLATATEKANAYVLGADRPWMGGTIQVSDFETNKTPTYTVVFTNTGKRPAKTTLTETLSVPIDYGDEPVYLAFDTTPSAAIVVPGQPVSATWQEKVPMDSALMALLDDGKVPFRIYAHVEYTDLRTGDKYWTHVCWRFMPKHPPGTFGFTNCAEYNDAR